MEFTWDGSSAINSISTLETFNGRRNRTGSYFCNLLLAFRYILRNIDLYLRTDLGVNSIPLWNPVVMVIPFKDKKNNNREDIFIDVIKKQKFWSQKYYYKKINPI